MRKFQTSVCILLWMTNINIGLYCMYGNGMWKLTFSNRYLFTLLPDDDLVVFGINPVNSMLHRKCQIVYNTHQTCKMLKTRFRVWGNFCKFNINNKTSFRIKANVTYFHYEKIIAKVQIHLYELFTDCCRD